MIWFSSSISLVSSVRENILIHIDSYVESHRCIHMNVSDGMCNRSFSYLCLYLIFLIAMTLNVWRMTLLEPQVGVFCILQARWVGKIAQGCKNLTNILAAIIYPNEELS